jgi:hypothetical protein
MLYAGSLVFAPPHHPVDLRNCGEWSAYLKNTNWRHHPWTEKRRQRARQGQPVSMTADQAVGADSNNQPTAKDDAINFLELTCTWEC